MTPRRALVLGGTGMLAGVAERLAGAGWRVVRPSRRFNPIAEMPGGAGVAARAALRAPGHRRDAPPSGRAVWVCVDWARPIDLAERVATALDGPADLLVAWVHAQYRFPVLHAVAPLLGAHAPVVEVRAAAEVPASSEDPVLPGHPTQQVILGDLVGPGGLRRPRQAEAVDAVAAAMSRALGGAPPSRRHIGEGRPVDR